MNCQLTRVGAEYRGSSSITKSGILCQRGDSHTHKNTPRKPYYSRLPTMLEKAENYCRNPDGTHGGLWCYTTNKDVRWELCKIQTCGKTPVLSFPFGIG